MRKRRRSVWCWFGVGGSAVLFACGTDGERASSGLGGILATGGAPEMAQSGGSGGGEPSPSAGTGGWRTGVSLLERAQAAVDSYVPIVHRLHLEFCRLTSNMPCYPGDPSCVDDLDTVRAATIIGQGCIPEDTTLAACLAALTPDDYECFNDVPTPKLDACPAEQAATAFCQQRWERMVLLTNQICSLAAGSACVPEPARCESAIEAESYGYGNVGCGAQREQLLICLARQTEYDFECRGIGSNLISDVAVQGHCAAAEIELNRCAR